MLPAEARSYDLRLVPAAIIAWLICIAFLSAPDSLTLVTGVVGAGLAVALVVGVLLRHRGRSGLLAITATVSITTVVAVAAILSVLPMRTGPVIDAASADVIATVDVTIESDVRRYESSTSGSRRLPPRLEARGTLHRIDSRMGEWQVQSPVILRVHADDSMLLDPDFVPGTQVQVRARVRPADYTPYAAAVLIAQEPATVIIEPAWWERMIHAIRSGLRSSVAGVPVDAGALVAGLAVGDESTQPPSLGEAMRVSGLSHLTAVSGGNIAIVLGAVIIIGRLLVVPTVIRLVIAALVMLGYVLVVGPEPSVLRAAGMGSVTVLVLFTGGASRGLSALAATVIMLLVLAPVLAVSLGFSLSVAATAGLLVVAPHLRAGLSRMNSLERIPERLRSGVIDALSLTVAAQITTAPILASLGQGLSLVAVPANVLAAPAVAPVTVLGLLAAVTYPILPPLGVAFGHVAAPFGAWIAWWARTLADVPAATAAWPGGVTGAVSAILAIVGVTVAVRVGRRRRWPLRTAAVVILAGITMLWLRPPDRAGWPPPDWVAVACDVGQGDALVIDTGAGSAMVVDAGPDPERIDSCLDALGIHTVEVLVLTHFHADHVEGTPGVLAGRDVRGIWVSPLREPVEQADRVAQWARGIELEPRTMWAGESVQYAAAADSITAEVIWPERIIQTGSRINNASLVLDVSVQGVRILALGDVEPEAQVALRAARGPRAFDVVKIPHHGSRFQDPRLAQWTGGRISIISVGADNDYGHPAVETVSAWQQVSARVMRTDVHGDIAIVDGEQGLGVVTRR